MNNDQFRKLVQNTPARQPTSSSPSGIAAQSSRNGATPLALGSRMRSSIPMTPRSIGGYNPSNDFARQLAERNQSSQSQTQKKFRATQAPKGAKLPEGYVDRARSRLGEGGGEEGSDKAQRVTALEELMKLDQIDEETFLKLRDEILGDSVGGERAGLVKGLDWGLLERVRRGEVEVGDVLDGGVGGKKVDIEEEAEVDDEFEKLEDKEVEAVVKEKSKKKGEMAPPSLTGKKRNRDQILAEMKAARLAAKEAAQPSLGAKFKKVGERRSESRIEVDGKGREVLITADENGNEKRKVRKIQVRDEPAEKGHGLQMPDINVAPLGMEVPELPAPVEEEEDIDIFDDVGDDYDPLAGLSDEDSDEDEAAEEGEVSDEKKPTEKAMEDAPGSMAPPPRPKQPSAAVTRNYFGDTGPTEPETATPKAFSDPTILAALKKASTLTPISKSADSSEEAAREARRKEMLRRDDRDAEDMDMGFGSSRFEDEEDFDDKKIKLSEWGGDEDGEEARGKGEKGKRKRGPKKRKGDANSAADVLKVIARRKGEKS